MTLKSVRQSPKRSVSLPVRLIQGISLVGIGVLSGGVGLAQSPASELVIREASSPVPAPAPAGTPETTPVDSPPVIPEFSPAPAPVSRKADTPIVKLPGGDAGYDAPTSIVLSERSSGCQTVLRSGRSVPSAICAPVEALSRPSNPVTAARVGSLSVVTPSSSVWDYYKRTLRPVGRLGNGNIRLIFPLAIPAPISSLFGWRTHPITGEQRFHSGTDLAAPLGTPVLAAYAGRVAIADFLGGYGLAVALEHNKATQQTLYGHLSEIFVKPGEWVKQGEAIGRVGSTGNSTGPHLHFEFRQLTPDGWVAMDAGQQLEYAMAQLVKAMQVAAAKPSPGLKS